MSFRLLIDEILPGLDDTSGCKMVKVSKKLESKLRQGVIAFFVALAGGGVNFLGWEIGSRSTSIAGFIISAIAIAYGFFLVITTIGGIAAGSITDDDRR